jgi:tetratricopeptide (TPR) repeat protein
MAKFDRRLMSRIEGVAIVVGLLLCATATEAATVRAAMPVPEIKPSPLGSYLAARQAETDRDYGDAARFMTVVLATDPANPTLIGQTFLFRVGAGDIAAALPLARRIADLDRRSGLADLVLVLHEIKVGNYREALRHADALPHDGVQRIAGPLIAAWAEVGMGHPGAALEGLAKTPVADGLPELTLLHRALIADVSNRIDEAARLYGRLTADGRRVTWRTAELAGNFDERHERVAAARQLYRALEGSGDGDAVGKAALRRLASGRIPQRLVATPQDGVAEVMFDLASILNQRETIDAALFYTRLAMDLRPDFPLGRLLLAEITDQEGHPRRALALYRSIDAASPLAWSSRLREAVLMDQLGETDKAVALLRRMAKERPENAAAWTELGDILRDHLRFAEAVTAYSGAMAQIHDPKASDWSLYYSRGVSLQRANEWPRAEADFREALKLQPDQPLVLNYLGYSWIDQGVHLKEALRMVARAASLRPNDGYIVDSLGWAYYRLGDYQKATANLERAIELEPEDPTINDHLGDVYWRTGRRREARYQWNRALEFKPEAGEVNRIEAKLDHGLGAARDGAVPSNGG